MSFLDLEEIDPQLPDGAYSTYDQDCILPHLVGMDESEVYLEIGVDKGKSLAFARYYSGGFIYGIDITDTLQHENAFIKGKDIVYLVDGSDIVAKTWDKPITLMFIDGEHTYEGVKRDWDNFSQFVRPGGTVFFHDCDSTSPGVVQLFDEIRDDPKWHNFILYKTPIANTSMASCEKKDA